MKRIAVLLAFLGCGACKHTSGQEEERVKSSEEARTATKATLIEDGRLELTVDRPIGPRAGFSYELAVVLRDGRRGKQSSLLSCGERPGDTSDRCRINVRLLPRNATDEEREVWRAFKRGNVKELTVHLYRSLDGGTTKRNVTEARFHDL
jgi:hypothetical protein